MYSWQMSKTSVVKITRTLSESNIEPSMAIFELFLLYNRVYAIGVLTLVFMICQEMLDWLGGNTHSQWNRE